MFYPVEGGSVYEIEDNAFGFVYKCHLPPIGYGVNSITGELQETDIIKRSDIPENQFWERYQLPKDWKDKTRREKEIRKINKDYFDPTLEEIRIREWKRRLCGVWFYNYNPFKKESELLYMTGTHYLYCTYWIFQGKHMDFRITDMEVFYILKYCETDPDCLGLNFLTRRKLGKCFGKDTPIRMYDGSVKLVQDIIEGELVMGDDSTARFVHGVTKGKEKLYEIKANKGESFICNESHVLSLIWNGNSSPMFGGVKKHDVVNISVKEYLTLPKKATTHLVQYRRGWGEYYTEKLHAIPPYLLGLFLGDGTAKKGDITSIDKEIVEYINNYATANNLRIHIEGGITHSIRAIKNKGHDNIYRKELKRIKVFGNKHIPSEYLIDSLKNRMELLAGLVDTDGCLLYNSKGVPTHYEITQSDNTLAYQIAELARSCGFHASLNKKTATMKRKDGTIYSSIVNRININGDLYKIPCKIERKKCHLKIRRKNSLNFGFKIKEIGEGEYYGFAVDKNNLFLLADGTVVHNTAISGVWAYDRTSKRPTNQHCGIQSKDDDGAEEVMKKAIIQPWKKLPDFFRPVYDLMKGDDPNELRFFNTSRRGSVAEQEREEEDALESWIDYGPATEGYYDGPELDTYISDEAGKVEKKISIKTRQDVVRYCSEIEGRMKGKQLYTTTVEADETTADEHEFQELVYDSNPLKRNENNRTTTGLYTYFLPAHKAYHFDNVYGYPNIESAVNYLMNMRNSLQEQGKLRALASAKRKNPMTLKEAFSVDGEHSLYNPLVLQEQLDKISWGDKVTETGNLVWKDGYEFERPIKDENGDIKGYEINEIVWEPNPNGRWEKVKGWWPAEPNKVVKKNEHFIPNNNKTNSIGCDPFKYDKTKDKRRSNCAAFNYQIKDNLFQSEYDDMFTLRYSYRPESTRMANNDILKMAWLCGCKVLFERNVNHWKRDFQDWHCGGFLAYMPGEDEPGIVTDGAGKVTQHICNYTESYINEHIEKVYFRSLIQKETGWLGFKVDDTQKFDEPMAAGFTLIAVKGKRSLRTIETQRNIEDILPYRKAI